MRKRHWLTGVAGLAVWALGFGGAAAAQTSVFDKAYVAPKDLNALFKGLPQPQATTKAVTPGTNVTMCGQPLPLGAGVKQAEERDLQSQQQQPPTVSLAFEAIYQLSSAAEAKAAVQEANRLAKGCQSYPGQAATISATGVPKLPKIGNARAALRTTSPLPNGAKSNAAIILEAQGAYVANLYATTTLSFTDKDVSAWATGVDKNFKKVAK